jgi:hypothetical protein
VIALPRRNRLALVGALLGVLVALAATLHVDDVQAVSYKSCVLSDSEARPASGKPTYNLIVKRSGATCATAKKVVNAFHKCRSASAASCKKTLLDHWRCTGKKESSTPVLFYGTFNCTYGKRAVRSSYQQNTG